MAVQAAVVEPTLDTPTTLTVEEQLANALTSLTTGLSALKRSRSDVTAADEAPIRAADPAHRIAGAHADCRE